MGHMKKFDSEAKVEVEILRSKLKEKNLQLIEYKDKMNEIQRKNNVNTHDPVDLKIELQTIKRELEHQRKLQQEYQKKRLEKKYRKSPNKKSKSKNMNQKSIAIALDIHRKLELAQQKAHKYEQENKELRTQLDRRLTEKGRKKLETKVLELEINLKENQRVKEIQRYISTRDLIQRDKKMHHLGLKNIGKDPCSFMSTITGRYLYMFEN
eukprot:UN01976